MEISDEGMLLSTHHSLGGRPTRRRICRICGQHHASNEPHVYDYVEEVDEDVSCHICLQPLVTPVDTPCGHTFCKPCLLSFLKVQQICPIDRKPLSQQLCSLSSLVLKKLLEKLTVKCPNVDQCEQTFPRGDLEDHLKYRCPGNWVSCTYSAAGCDFRGPQRSVTAHSSSCSFKDHGVHRSSIIEGEPSCIEIPRTQTALGISIVGGSDTPLRCIVVQEVFPDGLVAQDGRLQAGDQIIEIDGKPMTAATHHQICQILRRSPPVLRLGVYREKIDAYRVPYQQHSTPLGRSSIVSSPVNLPIGIVPSVNEPFDDSSSHEMQQNYRNTSSPDYIKFDEGSDEQMIVHITLLRESDRQLGIKLGGRRTEPGIFIMELMIGSVAEQDGRLQAHDRILAINGIDVRYSVLDYAFKLIKQSLGHISLVVSRCPYFKDNYEHLFKKPDADLVVAHARTKSAPDRLVELRHPHQHNHLESQQDTYDKTVCDVDVPDNRGGLDHRGLDHSGGFDQHGNQDRSASCESLGDHNYNRPVSATRFGSSFNKFIQCTSIGSFGEIDHNATNNNGFSVGSGLNKSSGSISMLQQATVRYSTAPDEDEIISPQNHSPPALPPRSRQPLGRTSSFDQLDEEESELDNKFDPETGNKSLVVSALPASVISALPPSVVGGGVLPSSVGALPSSICALPSSIGALPASGCADVTDGHPTPTSGRTKTRRSRDSGDAAEFTVNINKKSLRLDGNQLNQKTVTISKDAAESLGMRIGGGVSSNEGDIPIYIANIHPQGPVGKSKQVKKGDILLSVNGHTLLGLTHTEAVYLLKATAELAGVTLSLLDGPETVAGPANFVPSWLFWQKLPRALHISKTVVLHRTQRASLGFSIVGGNDPDRGSEPIHVLFVVSTSPAAVNGRLRCGDRLLAVDGHNLENVSHATAVCLLKQAGQRVTLEVVSWMGTEL